MRKIENSIKVGNYISFQNLIKTEDNDTIEIGLSEIKKITDKAILIEWDDSNWAYRRKCKSWIPRSLLIFMDSESILFKKKSYRIFYIAIFPEWVKIRKEIIFEENSHYPEKNYEDYNYSEEQEKFSSSYNPEFPISDYELCIDAHNMEEEQIEDDKYEGYLIEEYEREMKPWVDLWNKSIICRKCYKKINARCENYACTNHPRNPEKLAFNRRSMLKREK